ncbi:MAG: hypothetical protein HFI67_06175 [Lachnospiraceae bacterium]|jgi:hypothetical protein|nr:hypothetical protein [Lachnospiraceae bacterium]
MEEKRYLARGDTPGAECPKKGGLTGSDDRRGEPEEGNFGINERNKAIL